MWTRGQIFRVRCSWFGSTESVFNAWNEMLLSLHTLHHVSLEPSYRMPGLLCVRSSEKKPVACKIRYRMGNPRIRSNLYWKDLSNIHLHRNLVGRLYHLRPY